MICTWIAYLCESPDLNSANPLLRNRKGYGYSHASKMRASLTYLFTFLQRRGNSPFAQTRDGDWVGNPVDSDVVRRYMKSLKRLKVIIYFMLVLRFQRWLT